MSTDFRISTFSACWVLVFFTHFLSVSIPDSFIILKIPKPVWVVFFTFECETICVWGWAEMGLCARKRTFQCLKVAVWGFRFVQRKHSLLGLVWGAGFPLISRFKDQLLQFLADFCPRSSWGSWHAGHLPEDEGYEGDGDNQHVEQVEPTPTESVFVQDEPVGDDLQD